MDKRPISPGSDDIFEALPPPPGKRFRFSAKNIFLTYPQCPLPRERIADVLGEIGATAWVISVEHHEGGSPHLHALAKFANTFRTQDERKFDIDGYHPNIQSAKSFKHVLAYITKEDASPLYKGIDPIKKSWASIRTQATTPEEYLSLVETNFPREAALFWDRLQSYANARYNSKPPRESLYNDFTLPTSIEWWKFANYDHVKSKKRSCIK